MINLINQNQICNLGRLPVPIDKNPMHRTCLEIIDEPGIDSKETALYDFYQKINFKSLGDLYSLKAKNNILDQYQIDSIFLPWIHLSPVTNFSDPSFLKTQSTDAIENQINKLRSLISSIRQNGYTPEKYTDRKHGHITGYFLERADIKRFYVVSGNHRAAVLSSIAPGEAIKTIFEKISFMKSRDKENNGAISYGKMANVFRASQVNTWPSVRSGFLDEDTALQIFDRYIDA